ncbi:MAG: PTS sugar transporter subunit IIC [Clostridia bacterium]|nr:PTS sugar transporter subunit IIC [Clostridia bacterium]
MKELEKEVAPAEEPTDTRKQKSRFARFLARKNIVFSAKRYGIDALGAMALGLFGSLLIATIFNAIGLIPGLTFFKTIGGYGATAAGPAMAVAIAFALKAPPLVMYSAALVGLAANTQGGAGGPLAVLLIAIVAVEFGKAISKETKVDILVTPFVTVFVGGVLAVLVAPYIGELVSYIGDFIGWATEQRPFLMGLIISVVVGVALTLPISSAAICAAIGLSGAALATGAIPANREGLALAGGAAVAGCCAQMIGFAVMSFKENSWGGLVSQGLGTSMIQMPNIVRNPRIWIPPTLASAITGPLATCVFRMQMYGAAINSGMGTCGLLGPIGIILGWFGGEYPSTVTWLDWVGIAVICFILPALLSLGFAWVLRRIGWIKENDLKLD